MFLPRTRTKCRRQGDRSNPPTRVWASVVFLLCMCLLLVVPCVESRQPRTTVFLRRQSLSASQVVPRGGALPGSRVPITPQNNNLPYGQPQSSPSTTFHSPNPTQENTKDMIDAFLTRDSRNSFIGKYLTYASQPPCLTKIHDMTISNPINQSIFHYFHITARVYAILSVQLLVTAGSCVLFGLNPNIARSMYVRGSPAAAVPTLSLVLSTVAWFMMCANPDNRRKAPMKWNLLALFTIGEAISVGFISSFYRFASVVQAMVATGIATLAVSAYTILQNNPNRDLSQMGASLST